MKVLLDECVDSRLAAGIIGHAVKTVPEVGWAGLENGHLLARAQHAFDVLIIVDRKLPFQHDISRFAIAVIVLRGRSNRVADLRELLPLLMAAIPDAPRGGVTWVGS